MVRDLDRVSRREKGRGTNCRYGAADVAADNNGTASLERPLARRGVPSFPGYLFARANASLWHAVLKTRGVVTVVKQGGRPALLSDGFVTRLRDALETEGVAAEPVTDPREYNPGDEVIVQEGALMGLRGIVRERRSTKQLVIWVADIGRGVALTIGSALVQPAR